MPGLDVIDMEWQLAEGLGKPAILAGGVGALPNETDERVIHELLSAAGLVERQPCLGA
jgi:hypothetical protein